jgi:hypothetical protein
VKRRGRRGKRRWRKGGKRKGVGFLFSIVHAQAGSVNTITWHTCMYIYTQIYINTYALHAYTCIYIITMYVHANKKTKRI